MSVTGRQKTLKQVNSPQQGNSQVNSPVCPSLTKQDIYDLIRRQGWSETQMLMKTPDQCRVFLEVVDDDYRQRASYLPFMTV